MTADDLAAGAARGSEIDTRQPLRTAARLFVSWRLRQRRRAALQALMDFDDERLRDVGLTRDDIRRAVGEL
jgi:uncharacterized protein YjiS (DUF1127 family)